MISSMLKSVRGIPHLSRGFMVLIVLIILIIIALISYPLQESPKWLVIKTENRDCGVLGNVIKCFDVQVQNVGKSLAVFGVTCNFRAVRRTLVDSHEIGIAPADIKTFTCVGDLDWLEDYSVDYSVEGRLP